MFEILIYDEIGTFGPSSAFAVGRALQAAAGADVLVRVHSPGGHPIEAVAIRSQLEAYPGKVRINVDGMAASAAAYLLTVDGAEVSASRGAFVMIHRASVGAFGRSEDVRAAADLGDLLDAQTVEMLTRRTGKPAAEIKALIDAETWFTADEALAIGLIDSIGGPPSAPVDAPRLSANLQVFQRAPRSVIEKWDGESRKQQVPEISCDADRMDPKEIRRRLGLAEDATDAEVFSALDGVAAAQTAAPAAPPAEPADLDARIASAVSAALAAQTAAPTEPAAPAAPPSDVHATAVQAAVERFIADRKVRPADREKVVKACGETPAQLAAVVAYFADAPALLPAPAALPAAAQTATTGGPLLSRMARNAGVTLEQINRVQTTENA